MAGIGNGEPATEIGTEDEAGCESSVAAGEHALVHGGEDFAWTLRVVRQSAEGADQEGDGHGGGHAFAAYIADDDQDAAVPGWNDLKEVTANLTGGFEQTLDSEAGDGRDLFGDEDLLDRACSFEFCCHALLFAAIADEVA